MKKSQLNAISYAITRRDRQRAENAIIAAEGTLDKFRASRYKSAIWYLKAINRRRNTETPDRDKFHS